MAIAASRSLPIAPDWHAFNTTTGTFASFSIRAIFVAGTRSAPPPCFWDAEPGFGRLATGIDKRVRGRMNGTSLVPVTIKVDYVIGLTAFMSCGQCGRQRLQSGRTKYHEFHTAAHRGQPFDQRAGDKLVRDVALAFRASDHHERPEFSDGRGSIHGFRDGEEAAAQPRRAQGERGWQRRIPHQLPG